MANNTTTDMTQAHFQNEATRVKVYRPYHKPPFFARHPRLKKPLKITLFCLLVALLAYGSFLGTKRLLDPEPQTAQIKGTTIIAFGDSITNGYGVAQGKEYVSLLSQSFGEPVINLGKNGDTTYEALLRIDEVLKRDPKLVIIFLGGNDVLRRIPATETFANLAQIIEKIQTTDARIVLVAVPGSVIGDIFKNEFENLEDTYDTKEHPVVLIPQFLSKIITRREYMFDAIHPNAEGHVLILQYIEPAVRKLLGK